MKIVLALHQFPPVGSGGTEMLTQWTARKLVAQGHEVQIVSAVPRRRGIAVAAPPDRTDADGVRVRFLEAGPPATTLERIPLEYDDSTAEASFGRVLDAFAPDIVHFHHLAGLTAAALRAAAARGVPAMVSATDFWLECPTAQLLLPDASLCNGPDPDRANCVRHLLANRLPGVPLAPPRWAGPTVSALSWASRVPGRHGVARAWTALRDRTPRLRDAVDSAAVVLAPTQFLHGRLAHLGIAPGKLRLVPFGIAAPDPRWLRAGERPDADGRLRIAFAGSLAPSKGVHLLLEALALAPDLQAEVELFGGRSDDRYASVIERLAGNDRRIRFAGTFADGEFGAILARTDVLVIPSLWYENSPLVLLEALVHRCPVIVADVPGLVEPMRPDVDGWQFRRGDARDLAQRLAFVASRRDALTAVRRAPHATRSFNDYMTELLAIYEDLAGRPRTRT